jgi:hypothetical protein
MAKVADGVSAVILLVIMSTAVIAEAASFRHSCKPVDENRLKPCLGTPFNL